jgi:hypothetical protein
MVRGSKGGALVHVLRFVEFDPIEKKPRPVEHTIEFRGPASLWSIIRSSDGAVVADQIENRELAERRVASMATAQI